MMPLRSPGEMPFLVPLAGTAGSGGEETVLGETEGCRHCELVAISCQVSGY